MRIANRAIRPRHMVRDAVEAVYTRTSRCSAFVSFVIYADDEIVEIDYGLSIVRGSIDIDEVIYRILNQRRLRRVDVIAHISSQ
jgi:hypothetical protein